MRKRFVFPAVMLLSALAGCAGWQVAQLDEVQPRNFVEITLSSGNKIQGEVIAVEVGQTIIKTDGKAYKIDNDNITALRAKPSVYDDQGQIITEAEIKMVKTNKQTILYAIGGTALSFGTSFFIGSMIQRSMEDDTDSTPRVIATTLGTTVGGVIFTILGTKKDRTIAVENIKDLRIVDSENTIAAERGKRSDINKELELLKKLREAQDAEIEALRKKIEEQTKKKELEEKKKKKIPPR